MPPNEHESRALAVIDRILAKRPDKSGHDFAEAAHAVCGLRDAVIARGDGAARSPQDQRLLLRLNAVISIILAGQFPLDSVPWGEIEGARAWLAEDTAADR